ncbi:MAG: bifunctional heptose 7-phosphate kinase/heptose 1-phosphate adenyltransferase [Candidatus Nealsonbacteria bacterium]|nr:bifunctional heptose 7-phosphate kinase/heptose 1-phosphate adenyltransferase [Candidatus Nealsonbacteria bacterium]
MSRQLIELLRLQRPPRILVVGDVMLDRYVFGDVHRVSPEAPIPVLRVDRQEHRLGGAGSVAAMLSALEAEVRVVSVTGDDPEGETVRRLLQQIGINAAAVLVADDRPTTLKQRLLGRTHAKHAQQMIRVDREQSQPIRAELAQCLIAAVEEMLATVELVLLSDYDKGVCAGSFIPRVVEAARAAGVPVVADPVRGTDYHRYAGCTCVTPNRSEAAGALGMTIATPEDGLEAARQMLRFGVESAMVTLDRDGIAWADAKDNARWFPVCPRQVYDITGAGDMVLSALGYALAAGADWPTAVELANLAGGLEVERLGVVPISRTELLAELSGDLPDAARKILSVDELLDQLGRHRQAGRQVAMTNGCFDLLHPGHVASLQEARRCGDLLVVGLNSDESVQQLKGPGHPIVDQTGRAEMLAALACVDYVTLFDEPSVLGLIERVLPDVLVKSAEYAHEQVVGYEIVERNGGRVIRVPMKGSYSTSAIAERIREGR